MNTVLDINAAWTAKEPSVVALLEDSSQGCCPSRGEGCTTLSFDDIMHYQRIVVALSQTRRSM